METNIDISGQIAELIGLADGLRDAGRFDEAQGVLLGLDGLAPGDPLIRKALALVADARSARHLHNQDYPAALDAADAALALQPDLPDALNSRGNALNALGRHDEAREAFAAALALLPLDAVLHANLANALHRLGRRREALERLDRAIWLDAAMPAAHMNRGNLLRELGREPEALASYGRALALDPGMAEAHVSRANLLADMQRNAEALHDYDAALTLNPGLTKVRLNRGHSRLLLGDFEGGWLDYEARRSIPGALGPGRDLTMPLWLGRESLEGRGILLHCEQGMGDSVQFVRYAAAVAALGAVVVLEAFEALAGLLRTVDGVAQVITRRDPLPALDFHCPLMSLPLALSAATGAAAPPVPPYLKADPSLVARWRARLGEGLKVGIAVSGNPANGNDLRRSLPLAVMAEALPPGPTYVLIHREVRDDDKAALAVRPDILFPGEDIASYTDTAAICQAMDLIISVDTSVGHLAGALDLPVWILLSAPWDWRWRVEGDRSDWYPSARLYRQARRGDWSGALARVQQDLRGLIA